jgi:hypothetical protein
MKRPLLLSLILLGAAACQQAPVRSVVYYNFSQLDESADDEHYQQFADVNGGVVDFGCFVVERRQTNCYDSTGTGQPNLHLGVVQCECPCTATEPDPCDSSRDPVRSGEVRGLVNQVQGPLLLGGVEMPITIDLTGATDMFISVEKNVDPSSSPSTEVLLKTKLLEDGMVLRGTLKSTTTDPVQGSVTIVPVKDEVSL